MDRSGGRNGTSSTDAPARGSERALMVAGVGIGGTAAAALATLGWGQRYGDSLYSPAVWWWAVAAAVLGLAALLTAPAVAAPAVAAGGLFAAQLAGVGVYAAKHWAPWCGMGGGTACNHLRSLRILALAVAAVGIVTTVAALVALVRAGRFSSRTPVVVRVVAVLCGVGALVGAVLAADVEPFRAVTTRVAVAVVVGAPTGVALALSGWLRRPEALAVAAAVAVGSVAVLLTEEVVDLAGAPIVLGPLVAGAVVLVLRAAVRTGPDDQAEVA